MKKILRSFLKLDLFGESIGFQIDGLSSRKSILGAILSFAIFATVLPYSVKKYATLLVTMKPRYQKQ